MALFGLKPALLLEKNLDTLDGAARDGGPVVRGSDCFGLDRGDNVNFGVKGEK